MRKIILFSDAAAVLGFGASGAYANGPLSSPYEIIAPQPAQAPDTASEGRASFVTGDQNCSPARVRIHGAWHNVQVCD
jgi:hypothetical protein